MGDCSEINWTRERDDLRALIEQKEELLNAIGKVRTVMGDGDADASIKKELEKEYHALADQYTEVDEQGKQYFRESRRASFVWLYLRSKAVNQDLQASASATESGTTGTSQLAAEVEDAHDDGPTMQIYEGTVSFVHDLEVTSDNRDQMVGVDIHYHVCNDKLCLRLTTITKKIPLMSQN